MRWGLLVQRQGGSIIEDPSDTVTGQMMEGGYLPMSISPAEESGKLSGQPLEDVDFALTEKIFGNHLLREIILNHAIHQTDGFLDRETVCSIRAVGKEWNESVCKILHKNGEPLFRIFLGHTTSLNGGNHGEFLNQFTNTFLNSFRVLGRSPTYQVGLFEDIFREENNESLYNFLVGCGEGLVIIELYFPINGGSINGIFPNLKFPSLRTVAFTIDEYRLEGETRESDNVTKFIQSILNGAVALKTLTICHSASDAYPSSVFEKIVLPTSVNFIRLMERLSSADLEILLVKNHLPNLTSLTLETFGAVLRAGLLTAIFENLRGSVKHVSLEDNPEQPSGKSTVLFRFPRMEKLETFMTTTNSCQLEAGIYSLEWFLPKLRVLNLHGQSSDRVDRWTNGSRLSSVQELRLISGDTKFYLNREILARINLAFPKVTKLELDFDRISVPGLQYIFMEMRRLLDLKIEYDGARQGYKPIYWDSVLIGIPALSIPGLRAVGAAWEQLQINNDENPSIRKLTELRSFSLSDYYDEQPEKPFLTDLAFQFAFLKMPQLQTLDLYGNFSVSEEMAAKWGLEGRVLNYRRREVEIVPPENQI